MLSQKAIDVSIYHVDFMVWKLFPHFPDKGMVIEWRYGILSSWRHQMETFSALLAICAGNSPTTGEFSAQRPVMQSFDVFFDLRLNKRLSKQSSG